MTQPNVTAVSATAATQNSIPSARVIAPRSPLQLLADTVRLFFRTLPELVAIGAAGYLLLLTILLPAGWAFQTLVVPVMARPALSALLLVGGLALLAMTQALVTAVVSLALLQKQQGERVSVAQALHGALSKWSSLLALLSVTLVLLTVALVITGIPIIGAMLSPGLLAVVLILAALAPVIITTEPLRGLPVMARAWGLMRSHLLRAFTVMAALGLLAAMLLSLPAVLMLAAGLPLQWTDLWLPLLPGVFFAPLLGVGAVQLTADLRQRAAGIQSTSAPHQVLGRNGLLTLAEAGQLVVLSLGVVGLVGLLGLAGWGVWQLGPLLGNSPGVVVTVGSPAPDFQLETLAGQSVSLGELAGKPAIINFWATWCPPCKEEMPALEAAYQQHGDKVSFLAVSVQEDKRTVSRFTQQYGLSLPVLLDSDGVAMNLYGVRGLPTTLFVNAEGIVVAQHMGGLTEDSLAEYLEQLVTTGQ